MQTCFHWTIFRYEVNPADDPAWSLGGNAFWKGTVYAPFGDIDIVDGVIEGQILSGGSVEVHGGDPGPVDEGYEDGETYIDFVLSNHIEEFGYGCDNYWW